MKLEERKLLTYSIYWGDTFIGNANSMREAIDKVSGYVCSIMKIQYDQCDHQADYKGNSDEIVIFVEKENNVRRMVKRLVMFY